MVLSPRKKAMIKTATKGNFGHREEGGCCGQKKGEEHTKGGLRAISDGVTQMKTSWEALIF